ncbi:hypothetical protein COO60DRAFT_848277 [Scenedesmus sp. NREL 46B-D3]|nr:hypothetical protein COO60DRAFT_848277 [Scenedesmus sp. NREL 46B-D3]
MVFLCCLLLHAACCCRTCCLVTAAHPQIQTTRMSICSEKLAARSSTRHLLEPHHAACPLTHKQLLVLLVCRQGLCCWLAAVRYAQGILHMRHLHCQQPALQQQPALLLLLLPPHCCCRL